MLGRILAVTPLPPQAPSEESRPSAPRYACGRVSYPAAIPSTLCRGNPARSVAGVREAQPFRLLAQKVRIKPALDCAGGSVPGSIRRTRYHIPCSFERLGRSVPRPVRPSASPQIRCLRSAVMPWWVLPMTPLQSPAPHTTRPPPGPSLRYAPAPWSWQTLQPPPTTLPTNPAAVRLPATNGQPRDVRRNGSAYSTALPARRQRKGFIYILRMAAADAAAVLWIWWILTVKNVCKLLWNKFVILIKMSNLCQI
jgi:hypothetical protein